MTAQATRDALAEMDGWKFDPPEPCVPGGWWRWNAHPTLKSRTWRKSHPHPPTLDGADAAVRVNGWNWARYPRGCDGVWMWVGVHTATGRHIDVPDTGDKIADLYALALACRKAMENKA